MMNLMSSGLDNSVPITRERGSVVSAGRRSSDLGVLAQEAHANVIGNRNAFYREHGLSGSNNDYHRWLASQDQ